MSGRDRIDFRLARLERRAFGTETPTAGTDAGVAITSKDMLTRINELEAALISRPAVLSAARAPEVADLTGTLGTQWFDTSTGFWYREITSAWQQQP